METDQPTIVRFNPLVGVAFLVLGLLNAVIAVLQVARGGGVGVLLFLGLTFVLLGVLMLTRPYLRVGPEQVEVLGPIGIGTQRYPFRALRDEGGVPVVESVDGTRTRVAAQRWFARRADWDALLEDIGRGRWSQR